MNRSFLTFCFFILSAINFLPTLLLANGPLETSVVLKSDIVIQGRVLELTDHNIVIDRGENRIININFYLIKNSCLEDIKKMPKIARQRTNTLEVLTPVKRLIPPETKQSIDSNDPSLKDDIDTHFNQAMQLVERGDFEGALFEFDNVVYQDQNSLDREFVQLKFGEAYYQMGLIYLKKNMIYESKRAFSKAVEISPTHNKATKYLAMMRLNNGQLRQNVKALFAATESRISQR